MLGTERVRESLFTVAKRDDFVPVDHPQSGVRELVNQVLTRLSGSIAQKYADHTKN
jgi:hypothetical protein